MHEYILKKLPFKLESIEKTNKGLTNDNYLVKINNQKYMLRFPLKDIKHLFTPQNEKQVIDSLKDQPYVLPVKYYSQGIQLTKYVDNLKTFNQIENKDRIKQVASLMKQFHNSNIQVDHNFDPIEQIELYHANIKETTIDLSPYLGVINQIKAHRFKPVLCHNDWVAGNICFVDEKIFLIDFEYAGNNDRLFDVMSFLTENDLSINERKEFLDEMFPNGISKQDYETLKMYRDINNILWYLWAKMMYEFRKDNVYLEIADTKLNQLTTEYNQPLWK